MIRTVFAFLAGAAEVTSDGKLSMLGGDFDTIRVREFPFVLPSMALVVRLAAPADEAGKQVTLSFRLLNSDDGEVTSAQMTTVVATPGDSAERETRIALVVQFSAIRFEQPGAYTVRGYADDREILSLPLRIVAA